MGDGVQQPGPDAAQVRPHGAGQLAAGLRYGQQHDDGGGDDRQPDQHVSARRDLEPAQPGPGEQTEHG
jgi:hypothetical protein